MTDRNYKSRLHEIVPTTRFGQGLLTFPSNKFRARLLLGLASLFYLKRHKKRDDLGRAPVVSRLRAQSTLQIASSSSCNTLPFEVLIPMKTSSATPPPIEVASLK